MEPRDFCKLILSFSDITTGSSNYDESCLRILSIALSVNRKAMYAWGNPPNFDKFPSRYKKELQLLAAIKSTEHQLRLMKLDHSVFEAAIAPGSTNASM